jgi:uncharacterized protein (TIGR03546 family)
MVRFLIRPVRALVDALVKNNSSREIAAGFALGLVLGLVPKGNLIAVSLLVLLFSLRVNRGAGLVATFTFSWFGGVLDPFAHKAGIYLLTLGSMQATYASLLQLPLGVWFEFNNTVVAGSLAIGLYLLYPVFLLADLALQLVRHPGEEVRDATPLEIRIADFVEERRAA